MQPRLKGRAKDDLNWRRRAAISDVWACAPTTEERPLIETLAECSVE